MEKKYKITISEITHIEGEKYPDSRTVYEQTVDELDVSALVRFVNQTVNQGIESTEPCVPAGGLGGRPGGGGGYEKGGVIIQFKKRKK